MNTFVEGNHTLDLLGESVLHVTEKVVGTRDCKCHGAEWGEVDGLGQSVNDPPKDQFDCAPQTVPFSWFLEGDRLATKMLLEGSKG